jgi:hypothetical protein
MMGKQLGNSFQLQKLLTQSASFVIELGKQEEQQTTTTILRPTKQDAAKDLAHISKLLKTWD